MKIYKVKVNGKVYEVELESVTESSATIATPVAPAAPAATPVAPTSGTEVTSPMAGTIVAVKVQAGSQVKKGQTLVVLEAMKLENEIVAPVDGTVAQVLVAKGASVENKQVLVVLG